MTIDEIVKTITVHGNLKPIRVYYDNFDEANKKILEDAIIIYLNKFNRALLEILQELPKSLRKVLEMRKEVANAKDLELREYVLSTLCHVMTRREADKIVREVKEKFRSKVRMNKLMLGETEEIAKETEEILRKALDKDKYYIILEKQVEEDNPPVPEQEALEEEINKGIDDQGVNLDPPEQTYKETDDGIDSSIPDVGKANISGQQTEVDNSSAPEEEQLSKEDS